MPNPGSAGSKTAATPSTVLSVKILERLGLAPLLNSLWPNAQRDQQKTLHYFLTLIKESESESESESE